MMQVGFYPCVFGRAMITTESNNLWGLQLSEDEQVDACDIYGNAIRPTKLIERVLSTINNDKTDENIPIAFGSAATPFQIKVWEALRAIPRGKLATYKEISNMIGNPKAIRAVANACGANPIAIIIPCHRVVRSDGSLGGYRWGVSIKSKLLEREEVK